MDYSRFSPVALEVIKLAQREAVNLRHAEVAPEHLLVALASHQRARSFAMLRDLGVTIPRVQNDARKALGPARLSPFQSAGDSTRTRRVMELARSEASTFGDRMIGTEHLLLGLIRDGGSAKQILGAHGVTLYGIHKLLRTLDFHDGDQLPAVTLQDFPGMKSAAARTLLSVPIRPSRVFLGLLGLCAVTGLLLYLDLPVPQIPAFLFTLSGWIVLVSLHEFGHAFFGYLGGDTTVVNKGYLTLNFLKYTHRLLSIILPILFLILGGVPLPGGAVYIDRTVIRSRRMLSLMSAGGIIMQLFALVVLLIPYTVVRLLLPDQFDAHQNFWSVYTLLMYLDILGMVINLIPVPGIDGYGIIEPYLPLRISRIGDRIRPYGFLIFYMILILPNPINAGVSLVTTGIASVAGLQLGLVGLGFSLFQFWGGFGF